MFDNKYLDWNQKRIKFLLNYFGKENIFNKRVIDLGCGLGDIGGAFYRMGAEVTLVDGRVANLDIASKKFNGIKLLQQDLNGKFLLKNKFDIVLDLGIIPHIIDFKSHIQSACSIGDTIIIDSAVTDSDDPNGYSYYSERREDNDTSIHGQGVRPSASAIERILSENGFTFKRFDSKKLNSGKIIYDWIPLNNGRHNNELRRFWIAHKNFEIKRVIDPYNLKLENVEHNKIPLKIEKKAIKNIAFPHSFHKKKKVAVCISGHLRTFLDNIPSIKENLLNKFDCDVFIHTWDTLGLPYRPLDCNVKSIHTDHIKDKISKEINLKNIVIENNRSFSSTDIMNMKNVERRDISGVLSMFYKIKQCNNIKSDFEKVNNFKYDLTIRMRGDLQLTYPLQIEQAVDGHLYLPLHGNFGGACDQIAYGSPDVMDVYSNCIDNIDNLLINGTTFNPEKLLLSHINNSKLSVIKTPMKYVIKRSNGLVQDNYLLERAIGFK